MDFAKKLKISKQLLFFYLILFPFGQLFRVYTTFGGYRLPLDASDIIVGMILFIFLTGGFEKPKIWKVFKDFLFVAFFSLIFSFFLFESKESLIGGLYLLRLTAYFATFVVIFNLVKKEKGFSNILFKSLVAVSTVTAIFGWIQYFKYPDLRSLVEWGWDDHLYRIAGTFVDPGFISLIFVFGFLASFITYLKTKTKKILILSLFLLLTTFFTYARSGFLALIFGSCFVFPSRERFKAFLIILFSSFLIALSLPRPSGEGVKLERTASIQGRFVNYHETFQIIKRSPIFGIGFNNMCLARKVYLGETNLLSHSCSGSDSSLLLVLATTGVVGFLVFLHLLYRISKSVSDNLYGRAFVAVGVALLVHSFFANSLFYPWTMGWILFLYSIALKGGSME
jgi:hypothetical protein